MENGGIDAFPEDTEGMIAHVLSCTHALTSIGGLIFGGAFTARQQKFNNDVGVGESSSAVLVKNPTPPSKSTLFRIELFRYVDVIGSPFAGILVHISDSDDDDDEDCMTFQSKRQKLKEDDPGRHLTSKVFEDDPGRHLTSKVLEDDPGRHLKSNVPEDDPGGHLTSLLLQGTPFDETFAPGDVIPGIACPNMRSSGHLCGGGVIVQQCRNSTRTFLGCAYLIIV